MTLEELAEEMLGGSRQPHARRNDRTQPVHVFYGGADLFREDTPEKVGRLALKSLDSYAPDFVTFAKAFWLRGADSLPDHPDAFPEVENLAATDPERAEVTYPGILLAKEVFERTRSKLYSVPVEDLRIDFEDGYGFRSDEEEDADCVAASTALGRITAGSEHRTSRPMFGFRTKSLGVETRRRAVRTLELFITNLVSVSGRKLPAGFVVTLPKVNAGREVRAMDGLLEKLESLVGLPRLSIGLEVMIETPDALKALGEIKAAGGERLRGAHYGAYDHTSLLGIASDRQHLQHEACLHARNLILNEYAGSGLWLSDSVTITLPVPIHRGSDLKDWQVRANHKSINAAWRLHFNNVTRSMNNGYYQSWDLHPAQLVARYAAVYSFYLESAGQQTERLRSFIEKASRATLTGSSFDDAASAEGILNFLRRGCACGALEAAEIADAAGLTPRQLLESDFKEIVENG